MANTLFLSDRDNLIQTVLYYINRSNYKLFYYYFFPLFSINLNVVHVKSRKENPSFYPVLEPNHICHKETKQLP